MKDFVCLKGMRVADFPPPAEDPDGFVHWNSFSKGGCQKNVNVWLWLNGILDLIKKHLADLWRDG